MEELKRKIEGCINRAKMNINKHHKIINKEFKKVYILNAELEVEKAEKYLKDLILLHLKNWSLNWSLN